MKKILIGSLLAAACLACVGLHAESENAVYLLAGPDAKILTNTDASNYFGNNNGTIGTEGYGDGVVHLGLQIKRWMSIEASLNLGPFRDYEVLTYNSSDHSAAASQVKTDWTLYTYSITPAITWANRDYVNSLGIRLGCATLAGHVDNYDSAMDGSYDQNAVTPDIGVLFRTSTIFVGHVSAGVELGYDYTVFTSVDDSNGTGSYSGISGPEHNINGAQHNGSQTTLNFSGPHIALVFGLWSNDPVVHHPENADPMENTAPAENPAPARD